MKPWMDALFLIGGGGGGVGDWAENEEEEDSPDGDPDEASTEGGGGFITTPWLLPPLAIPVAALGTVAAKERGTCAKSSVGANMFCSMVGRSSEHARPPSTTRPSVHTGLGPGHCTQQHPFLHNNYA